MFLEFRQPLYSCTEGKCHSSTRSGTSLHVTQFYQTLPHVSAASDKHWGEKAWVQTRLCLYYTHRKHTYVSGKKCLL